MGATADGKKELLAVADAYRESEQSWKEVLLDLKDRGLEVDPEAAVGDGALEFLEGVAPGLAFDTGATLLRPSDRQRAQQIAKECSTEGQGGPSSDLDGSDSRRGAAGI
jgi:hypothetical protein